MGTTFASSISLISQGGLPIVDLQKVRLQNGLNRSSILLDSLVGYPTKNLLVSLLMCLEHIDSKYFDASMHQSLMDFNSGHGVYLKRSIKILESPSKITFHMNQIMRIGVISQ
jgi:hypothetical protein